MQEITFIKVVCEELSPFEKEILVDRNCKDVAEVSNVLLSHPELMKQNNTWILYPMSVKI